MWIRWLFIEDIGKYHQNSISHEKRQQLWKKGMRHVWSSNDYLSDRGGEEGIVLLDNSHFRLPPQHNLFCV